MNNLRITTAWLLGAGAIGAIAAASVADTFTESFDAASNIGGWSYFGTDPEGASGPELNENPQTGGNPDWYIRTPIGYATFAPTAQTEPGTSSIFLGNWQQQNVSNIGIDMLTAFASFSTGGRPISLRLWNDNGTPFEFLDDWGFWFVGTENMPHVGEGWKSYDFDIDSQAADTPDGWIPYRFNGEDASDLQWSQLMQDVDRVDYYHGEPDMFYILQDWVLGLDNARITTTPPSACPADLTGDETVGPADLAALLASWGGCGKGECPADIAPPDAGDGTVGPADLATLLAGWGACE